MRSVLGITPVCESFLSARASHLLHIIIAVSARTRRVPRLILLRARGRPGSWSAECSSAPTVAELNLPKIQVCHHRIDCQFFEMFFGKLPALTSVSFKRLSNRVRQLE
jgi:hypothetical protein